MPKSVLGAYLMYIYDTAVNILIAMRNSMEWRGDDKVEEHAPRIPGLVASPLSPQFIIPIQLSADNTKHNNS